VDLCHLSAGSGAYDIFPINAAVEILILIIMAEIQNLLAAVGLVGVIE
jgi:hypothetical protein